MGMFDTVNVAHLSHPNFKTACKSFQTKDLECNDCLYSIFNNRLYVIDNGFGAAKFEDGMARPSDYTGEISMYDLYRDSIGEYWIEFTITFENGLIVALEETSNKLVKDLRDRSALRPASKTDIIHIEYKDLDADHAEYFHQNRDEILQTIRTALKHDTIEIAYKIKTPVDKNDAFPFSCNSPRWARSMVQHLKDLNFTEDGVAKTSLPNGGEFKVILDEMGYYLPGRETQVTPLDAGLPQPTSQGLSD